MTNKPVPVDLRVEHVPTDEWRVLVDGREVVAFAGPQAEVRAKDRLVEIRVRMQHLDTDEQPQTTR